MASKPKVNWKKVSSAIWLKQDVEVAKLLGVSRERVRQVRPAGMVAENHRKHIEVTAWQRIAGMVTDGKTMIEVAKVVGCGAAYAGVAMRRMGKGYVRMAKGNSKYNWRLLPPNWRDLTDKEMAGVIGASSPAVVTQWRIRHGMRKR